MPQISIIIATCNRAQSLKKTLESLWKQKCEPGMDCEIIVVDNNSQDQTKAVVESYQPLPQHGAIRRLRYVFEPKQGKCHALNRAIQEAKGDIFVFTDDDVIVDPGWLSAIQKCFAVHSCDGMGGRVLPLYPEGTPKWVKENSRLLSGPIVMYDYGEETVVYRKPAYEFIGANFAFKKDIFIECGLFRTDIGPGFSTMGDDTEFVSRVQKKNKNLYYCGQALAWHPVDVKRTNLQYIRKWNIQLGRYRFLVDENGKLDETLVYIGGVPRYLLGDILRSYLVLAIKIFRPSAFLKEWVKLSRNLGRAMEMRRVFRDSKQAQ